MPRGHVNCASEKAHSVKDLGFRVLALMESKLEEKFSNGMETGETCIYRERERERERDL